MATFGKHKYEPLNWNEMQCGFVSNNITCGEHASADIHHIPRSANSNMEATIKRAEEEETGTLVNEEKNQSGVASRNESQFTGLDANVRTVIGFAATSLILLTAGNK